MASVPSPLLQIWYKKNENGPIIPAEIKTCRIIQCILVLTEIEIVSSNVEHTRHLQPANDSAMRVR